MRNRILNWFLLMFLPVSTEGFSVQGSVVPLGGSVGGSVMLPCYVDNPLPLKDVEVTWLRADSALVHLIHKGEIMSQSQDSAYSGRAKFFAEEISKGNFSLLLMNLTTEDKGVYNCVVRTAEENNKTSVKVNIEWLIVTGTHAPIFAHAGENVILNCSVDTHLHLEELQVEWIKTDKEILVLLFQNGQNIPESQHERFIGRAEFFTEEIANGNFSVKLTGVRTEDKGEFMCKVHSNNEKYGVSGNATAWLQELGFSPVHVLVLIVSVAAAVASIFLAVADSKKKSLFHHLNILVPCIMLFMAFILWVIIEGFAAEVCTCSIICVLRILILYKVSPDENSHGDFLCLLKKHSGPIVFFAIITGENTVVLSQHLTGHTTSKDTRLMIGLMFGMLLILLMCFLAIFTAPPTNRATSSQSYLYSKRAFLLLSIICSIEVFFLVVTRDTIMFSFDMLKIFICSFGIIICAVLKTALEKLMGVIWQKLSTSNQENGCTNKRCAGICYIILFVGLFLLQIIFSFLYLDWVLRDGEGSAWMCFIAFLYIVTATSAFPPSSPPKNRTGRKILYYCGSVSLTVVNSVALVTELIQKAKKGERTVEDLRIIVLSSESTFYACWLGVLMYENFWDWLHSSEKDAEASQQLGRPP